MPHRAPINQRYPLPGGIRPCPHRDPARKIAPVVWQPNSSQWRLIWILAIVIVLFWPGQQNRSLAIKALNWVADIDRMRKFLVAPTIMLAEGIAREWGESV